MIVQNTGNRDIRSMINRLSPILIVDRVKSTPYALRLTPLGRYDIQDFISECLEYLKLDYISSTETSKQGVVHYHMVIWYVFPESELRKLVQEFLKKYFPEPPKRGDANKRYNLKVVGDLEKSIIYLLKDGGDRHFSSNINLTVIDELSKRSFKKYTKVDFASELEVLKDTFKQNDVPIHDMMVAVIQLKSTYRQPINLNNIHSMCISFHIHNKPGRAVSLVSDYLLSKRM